MWSSKDTKYEHAFPSNVSTPNKSLDALGLNGMLVVRKALFRNCWIFNLKFVENLEI